MMPVFTYQAYDRKGDLVSGEIVSPSREAALELLSRRDEFPTQLSEGHRAPRQRWWEKEVLGGTGLARGALALFTRELATLLVASVPVDEALRIIASQPSLPRSVRRLVGDVLDRIIAGGALSDALAAQGSAVPEYVCRLAAAGERSGRLGEVLTELADFLEQSAGLRSRVSAALLYPAFLVVAAIITLAILAGALLPAIAPLFADAGVAPPLAIRVLLALQDWSVANGYVAAGLAVVAVAGLVWARRSAGFAGFLDRVMRRLPIVGGLVALHQTGRYARTLATLLRSGVPMLDALRLARDALTSAGFRDAADRIVEAVGQGGRIGDALGSSGVFSVLAARLAAVGERTGQLDGMLTRLAEMSEAVLERRLDRLASLISPCLTLLVGGLVGIIVVSVMSTIISLNELALR